MSASTNPRNLASGEYLERQKRVDSRSSSLPYEGPKEIFSRRLNDQTVLSGSARNRGSVWIPKRDFLDPFDKVWPQLRLEAFPHLPFRSVILQSGRKLVQRKVSIHDLAVIVLPRKESPLRIHSGSEFLNFGEVVKGVSLADAIQKVG